MNRLIKTLRVEKASTRKWGQMTPLSLVLFGILFSLSIQLNAQIETMYSLYRFNPQVLTPVQAGSTLNSEMILMYRNQWVGIEGAPRNLGFSGNFKWGKKKGIGVGALVDEAGPVRSTILSGDFAYHVNIKENLVLDGGIRMGMANIALNLSQVRLVNANDNLFAGDRSTGIQPNLGWGLRLAKKDDGFFISLSQPRVLKYDFGTYSGAFRDVAYYYAMAGTKIGLGGKVETSNGLRSRVILYPSILFRLAVDVPLSYDVNLTANLKGKLDVGLSYRREDSYGLRLGVQATKKIYLGYVFELPISEIRKASSQTHEMGIRFFIFDKVKEKKDELLIEDSERSNKNKVEDFGPYAKKDQAETPIVNKVETTAAPAVAAETKKEVIKQEVKTSSTNETTQKEDLVETAIVKAMKPKSTSSSSSTKTTTTTIEEAGDDEDDFEYVTVTKTRVVLKRPKVANNSSSKVVSTTTRGFINETTKQVSKGTQTVNGKQVAKSQQSTNGKQVVNSKQVASKSQQQVKKTAKSKPKATTTSKSIATTAATTTKASSTTGSSTTTTVVESNETKVVDPNAPKITKRKISSNITETIVEKRGATETEISSDGKTKISKRTRKDGTEETTYTTTEVIKKKKEK